MKRLLTLFMCLVLALGMANRAQAFDCAPLRAVDEADKAVVDQVNARVTDKDDVVLIQGGVRSLYGNPGRLLSDSIIGPVTVGTMGKLCVRVPLTEGTDALEGTIALSREFGVIDKLRKQKLLDLTDKSLLTSADPDTYDARIVRFAASAPMAAAALENWRDDQRGICDDLVEPGFSIGDADLVKVQNALTALIRNDPKLRSVLSPRGEEDYGPATQEAAAAVCDIYPVIGSANDFVAAMEDLGTILDARSKAVVTLGSDPFRLWLAIQPVTRVSRLLGTPPAVIALLEEFDGYEPADDPVAPETPDVSAECPRPNGLTQVEYFALSVPEIEALKARANVQATLEPVLEQRFDTQSALKAAVAEALAVVPGSCGNFRLGTVMEAFADTTGVYSLDAQRTKDLALDPALGDVLPALSELGGAEAGNEEDFQSGLQEQIEDAAKAAVEAAIDEAVDAAAKAAEDIALPPDTAAQGLPEELPPEDQPKPELAITDQSMAEIEARLDNREIIEAIGDTDEGTVESRDEIAKMVFEKLIPMAPDLAEKVTDAALSKIDEFAVVEKKFRLTPEIISSLATSPEFAALSAHRRKI